jgi:hypothetical protein
MKILQTANALDSDVRSVEVWCDNGNRLFDADQDFKTGSAHFHDGLALIEFDTTQVISETERMYFVVVNISPMVSNLTATLVLNWQSAEYFGFAHPVNIRGDFPISTTSFPLPIKVSDFSAHYTDGDVLLTWRIADAHNIYEYFIEKSTDGSRFFAIHNMLFDHPIADNSQFNYADKNVTGNEAFYRLKFVERDGTISFSDVLLINFVKNFNYALDAPYPNPFNAETCILFTLPHEKEISLTVYNITGEKVRSLVQNRSMQVGIHKIKWDGTDDFGHITPTGIYFISLNCNEYVQVRKIIHAK